MRIGACDVRVNQGGSFAAAAVFRRPTQNVITRQRISPIAFLDVQARVVPNESRDAAACGLRVSFASDVLYFHAATQSLHVGGRRLFRHSDTEFRIETS